MTTPTIPDSVREQHRRAISRLAERFAEDDRYSAIIVGGSVANGRAREDSDVDILMVADAVMHARYPGGQNPNYRLVDEPLTEFELSSSGETEVVKG